MKKIIIIFAALTFGLIGCDETDEIVNTTSPIQTAKVVSNSSSEEMIKLGKKLDNPYSVENIRKAYQVLLTNGSLRSTINIEPTHLYVRFLPKTEEEYQTLKKQDYIFFDYPLDYERVEGGTYYHDPSIPENNFTWQYVVLPVDYTFTNIQYQILSELVLLESDVSSNVTSQRVKEININSWSKIEEKSFELTGNEYGRKITTSQSMQRARIAPGGIITAYDDILHRSIPLEGVKVRAYRWFVTKEDITNDKGEYKIDFTFSGAVDYSIVWERPFWNIRDGLLLQAYYNGPHQDTNWNLNLDYGKSKYYAHVHRACWTMFYGDNLGTAIKNDLDRSMFLMNVGPIKISVYDSPGTGVNYGSSWFGLSDIGIYCKNNIDLSYYLTYEVFGTTIHELAHTFHIIGFPFGLAEFAFVSGIIQESWPRAVSWAVTNNEYKRLGYLMNFRPTQDWAIKISDPSKNFLASPNYSPIFIDLVDNVNQGGNSSSMYEYPTDSVVGFTMTELRSVLPKTFNVTDLKNNVKALRTDNSILSKINKLFETYEKAK